ncbi:hypothetical protein RDV78_11085 [Bacillota bacterium LX-D]|nr:hypothetical protein [Bacillota bacterium LX-D]
MEHEKLKEKEKECNCCIKIEDSIVIIICGDIENDKIKNCLDTIVGEKGNKKF